MLPIVLWACASDTTTTPTTDTPGRGTAETGAPVHSTAPHSAPTHSATPSWPELRCSDLVPGPLVATVLDAPRATHDVAFDDQGRLVGSDGTSLLRWPHEGAGTPWVPGLGEVHQFDWLPDGGLAVTVAASGFVERIDPDTGGRAVLASGVPAYALRSGPDGRLWTADGRTLSRFDPVTGQRETLVASLPDGRPKAVAFDHRARHAFLGTVGGTGTVYRLELDRGGDPVGEPQAFASHVGGGYHDAVVVDACGNVYVTDALTSSIVRLDPDGTAEVVLDPPTEGHAHGLRFGSGLGGWRSDALYAALPYGGDRVAEIVVGVPDAAYLDGRYVTVP